MKNPKYRTFEIPRGEGDLPYRFAVHTGDDGRVEVTRISPYDETEYHWALKSPGKKIWRIIRNGSTVSTVGTFAWGRPVRTEQSLTPEEVAYFLLHADEEAHLEPCNCRD